MDKTTKAKLDLAVSLNDIELLQSAIGDFILAYHLKESEEKSLNLIVNELSNKASELEKEIQEYEEENSEPEEQEECNHCGASPIMCSCDWRGLK